jgi:hypothetical protein
MAYDHRLAHALYKKLLTLYPRRFKEQLGESMEQTFHDLYGERKQHPDRGVFIFMLWIFIETTIGIFRERLLLLV